MFLALRRPIFGTIALQTQEYFISQETDLGNVRKLILFLNEF